MSTESASFSLLRTILVAVPVAALVAGGMTMWNKSVEDTANMEMQRNVLSKMLAEVKTPVESDFKLIDNNGDLLADTPEDEAGILKPESLVFSYIAEELEEGEEADYSNWTELLQAIDKATGLPVTTKHFEKTSEQLAALRAGEVHVIGLSTGAAPLAVKTAGFVPLCTLAKDDGTVGYTMQFITGAKSPLKELKDVAGKKVVFVRPTSNSGFKAAFVQLHDDAGLLPEQDYDWSFSLSHEVSIRAALNGGADAAPIASDILVRMIDSGEVAEDEFRVIYESEAFPPAVIGCAYNLPPEMIEQIGATLTGFEWAGTGLEKQLGPMDAASFSPVDYKDDWANIRRIDTTVNKIIEDN
ncbi:MAG: phosphate/phosphite/phosphonate ABC transporter substrate-binding protein [Planctomycetota bacterium]